MSQIDDLFELQEADLLILRSQKRLEALPQREAILTIRKRGAELEAKSKQLQALKAQCEAKMEELQAKDAECAAKIKETQELINAAFDFRTVDSLTEDLETAVRAQEKVDFDLTAQLELMERIEATEAQTEEVRKQLKASEQAQIDSFKAEGGKLQSQITAAKDKKAQLKSRIDPQVLKRYESLFASRGGIAVSENLGNRCSACNVIFQEGQRIALAKGPAIATCPSCGRMLLRREG